MDSSWLHKLLGGSAIGAGAMGMFGHNKNPADAANHYIKQIQGQTQPHYQPWEDAGRNMLDPLQQQYGQLMNDPGGKFNQIGESFHESPGFKFALQQALQGNSNQANASGMGGSPQQTQQDMTLATNLANQDYYNYMQGAGNLYSQGLQGGQQMANQGQQAGQNQADQIAQALAQQAAYGYEGQGQRNQNKSGAFNNILGGLSSFLF